MRSYATTTLQSFPFIVGCGRSGTTLVRAMLDAHPAMAVPGESYFPLWLGRVRHRYEHGATFDATTFVDDLLKDAWFRRWGLPAEGVRQGVKAASPTDFPDAVRAVYRLYARHRGKVRYGDKTPTFVLHVEPLSKLFPEATFVQVVRDGRDVALSLIEADWGPRTIGQAALHWELHARSGARSGARLGPGRYSELRYEDVVGDPGAAVDALCRVAGLERDEGMLRYFEGAEPLLAGLPDAEEHQNLRLPPTAGIRDWRAQMAEADAALFEALAGETLARFGYERLFGAPTRAVRARAARERLAWEARRRARRLRSQAAEVVLRR